MAGLERRVKRVYNYRNGLVVMTFEDSNDAILFDPPRLTLWTFANASEAFDYAKDNRVPVPAPPASIPMGVGLHTVATKPKTAPRHNDTENFIPIANTALILD